MNLYAGLLFLGGHIADPKLARSLDREADRPPPAPPAARPPAVRDDCARRAVRRGGIVSLCSAVLSPFR